MRTLFLLLLTWNASGQVSLSAGAGGSTRLSLIMESEVQVKKDQALIGAGFNAHMSNDVRDPVIIFARGGYLVPIDKNWSITPHAGISYHFYSNNKASLVSKEWLASLQIEKQMEYEFGKFYLNCMYTGRIFLLSLGLKAVFR
jgi:hypothetical protein